LGGTAFVGGISGSYESSQTRVNGASGQGDRYQVGMMLGWRPAQAELTLYGTLGTGSMDVLRPVATPGGASVASGRQRFGFGQYGAVAGYNFQLSALSIRPAVEAGYAHYVPGGFTEGGAGPLNLTASTGTSAGVGFVRPQVSVAGHFTLGATVIEPYLAGAYTRRFTDRVSFRSSFVGAPQGAGDFAVARFLDRDSGQLRVGVTANTRQGIRLTGEYSVTAGQRTLDQSLQAKISLTF
jgi:outer membrane autotransporter protein